MAKQDGTSPLRGQVGGIVYYKHGDSYVARGAGSLDKKRVLKDPAFAGSRRASAAFGQAAKASSLVRNAMGGMAKKFAETKLTGRMNKVMMDIIKTDPTTEWKDEQLVYRGDMSLLKGTAWHEDKRLGSVLTANYNANLDRSSGVLEVSIAKFSPKKGLNVPAGATHLELFACGAALDFEKAEARAEQANSGMIAVNSSAATDLVLACNVGAGSTKPLVLGLGIAFYQEVSGRMELLMSGGCFEIVGAA
jgi:hypothetical protein